MSAPSTLDIQLSKYWSILTPAQKQSLLQVIKSFSQSTQKLSIRQYNQEIKEAEEEYKAGNYITQAEMLKLIKEW